MIALYVAAGAILSMLAAGVYIGVVAAIAYTVFKALVKQH